MADPFKPKPEPAQAPLPQAEPTVSPFMPKMSVEAEALAARQAFEAQRYSEPGGGVAMLPNGERRRLPKFTGGRYTLNKQAAMLGNPESILTEEYLREHRGWKFSWPVADADETRMYLKNQFYMAVPPEAVRKDVDFAIVGDSITVQGSAVSWKRHILVAMPYEFWHQQHVEPADYAMERTATGQEVANNLNQQFGGAGYRAEVSAFADAREEKI